MKKQILLVEDRPDIAELIAFHLAKEGYEVVQAYDGEEAVKKLSESSIDLIVLDLMLPKISGLEILKKIKQDPHLKKIPVIIESARGDDADIIMGLEMGAEDYVTKPFSPRVLLARVRKIFQRAEAPDQNSYSFTSPHLFLNSASREVKVEDKDVELTAIEFDLLMHLLINEGKVMSREKILQTVWMDEVLVIDRVVDVHINSLRKKLGNASSMIETVRGIGYKFRLRD
jgi:two-component system, OmpR family, alkaline phosphatase synthesis response regulator PhoP